MLNLVDCYEKMGQAAKGEPLLRELTDLWKQKTGIESLPYASQLAALGANLVRQKKAADADTVLRTCLAIRRQKQPEAWTTFRTQSLLGEALLLQGKHAEAEPLLIQAYEAMKQRADIVPPSQRRSRLTEALERLVQFYEAAKQPQKADVWRQKLQVEKQRQR